MMVLWKIPGVFTDYHHYQLGINMIQNEKDIRWKQRFQNFEKSFITISNPDGVQFVLNAETQIISFFASHKCNIMIWS